MTARDFIRKWLTAAPLTGRQALLCAIVLLAVPTIVRGAVNGLVLECAFIPYIPFVLIASLLLDWRQAALFALVAGTAGDLLFTGADFRLLGSTDEVFGLTVFLLSSALIIAVGAATKSVVADPLWLKGPNPESNGVVFSLERGEALVSWHGERSFVHLGAEDDIAELMEDFLKQRELGKRLSGESCRCPGNPPEKARKSGLGRIGGVQMANEK